MLQPLQFSGELSYSIADKAIKTYTTKDNTTGLTSSRTNNGNTNQWIGGMSVQYSISYLQLRVLLHHGGGHRLRASLRGLPRRRRTGGRPSRQEACRCRRRI